MLRPGRILSSHPRRPSPATKGVESMKAQSVLERVANFVERVEARLLAVPPSGEFIEVSPVASEIMSWYARTRSLFSAARFLLDAGYPEEAMILTRSIFETSLRLEYLAAVDETGRAALVLGEISRAMESYRQLDRQRRMLRPDPEKDQRVDSMIDKRLRELQSAKQRLGISRPRRFPGDKDMAKRFGHLDSYFGSRLASEITHGGHLAQVTRTRPRKDEIRIFHRNTNAWFIAGVGVAAAEAALHAQCAIASILGWDVQEADALVEECAQLDQALEKATGESRDRNIGLGGAAE